MPGQDEWLQRYSTAMMNNFAQPSRVLVRGQGVHVWDADGKRYTDLLAGIAVHSLGHAHPVLIEALCNQARQLGHISNIFASPQQIELAEKLVSIATPNCPDSEARVYFANSGSEANEAAFKLTRLTGRTRIIAMEGSFHGRTMGSLAITSNAKYRTPFEPMPGDVEFVPFGDVDALEAAVDDRTAAVVVETIQGENGVVVAPGGFLQAARRITDQHGALLWIDEVQTGMGRTGAWLDSAASGVTPDLITFAKGLGNGFPIGACVAIGRAASFFTPGTHGSTYVGNPLGTAVALAVIHVIESEGLLDHVQRMGEHLARGVMALGHPAIRGTRGRGLMRAIVLRDDIGPAVYAKALDAGFILNSPRPSVLRIVPPLNIQQTDLDAFLAALPGILDEASRE